MGSAPEVNYGNLVHARNRAARGAALLRQKLALPLLIGIIFQWNARVPTLLRAIMNEAVLADIQIARTGPAPPVVLASLCNVVLEIVQARERFLP